MKNVNDLYKHILANGQWEPNRTGIDTITTPGEMLKFDLRDGFPAVTCKKLAFNPVKGELVGFLRGVTSAADFRALGCKVWDQNANENAAWLANPNRQGVDDLGPVYGAQWRRWLDTRITQTPEEAAQLEALGYVMQIHGGGDFFAYSKEIDQLAIALNDVRNNSQSRRIRVTAWNPGVLDLVALPACHTDFQFLPRSDGTLHMCMYMRSVDTFLGLPFNIASYALLLELFARWTGRTAATLTMFLADTHIYRNHMDQVHELLSRTPFDKPQIDIDVLGVTLTMGIEALVQIEPSDIQLINYQHHAAIQAPMAV